MKACCQSSGGHPATMGVATPNATAGIDTLGFLTDSWALVAAFVTSIPASLSLRFAPACDGADSRSADAVELEESDTSMSEEESPSSS